MSYWAKALITSLEIQKHVNMRELICIKLSLDFHMCAMPHMPRMLIQAVPALYGLPVRVGQGIPP